MLAKFGGGCGLWDGLDDYLSIPGHTDWSFDSGAFTVEFWVNFNILDTGTQQRILNVYTTSNLTRWTIGFVLYLDNLTWQVSWRNTSGSLRTLRYTSTINAIDVWHHIAWVRNSSNWYLWEDGSQLGSTDTDANTIYSDTITPLTIGASGYNKTQLLNGHLDEVRISKGIARYTSSFTPPSNAFTSDSYTKLLLHLDTDFTDSGNTGHTITNNGVTIVQDSLSVTKSQIFIIN